MIFITAHPMKAKITSVL